MCEVCKNLKGKTVVDTDLYYSLLQGNVTKELKVGTTYEVEPSNDTPEPDFTYDSDDINEMIYVLLFLGAFSTLYQDYKGKDVDYAISNIEKDTKSLLKELTPKVDQLEEIFNQARDQVLLDTGILKDNLNKVKSELNVKEGILEQKTTLKGITSELSNNIKAKAHFLKNRAAEEIFNVKSNFNRAANRTKQMAGNGYQTTKAKAKRAAQIFLYDDPDAYWVTKRDGRVCPHCVRLEFESPMPLSKMPYTPLHLRCRCKVVLAKDLTMNEDAMELMYHDIAYS